MFNNDFSKFLKRKYKDSFDVGGYHYTNKILGFLFNKKGRLKMPIDMAYDGLLITGCQKSYRRRLAALYAKELVKRGNKVLFITDALREEQYRAKFEAQTFKKHIGLDEFDKGLVSIDKFTGEFNREVFDNGALLSILTDDTPCKWRDREAQKEYNAKLIQIMGEIVESKISPYTLDKAKPRLVVFVDDSAPDDKEYSNALFKAFRSLRSAGDYGFVACTEWYERYIGQEHLFKQFVFFRIKDTTMMREVFSFFDKRCMQSKYLVDERDLRLLHPKEFHYTVGNYCGWSFKTTFDAGGCECCLPEPEDYYLFDYEGSSS
ncbi:hypothetical protein OTK49_00520 [Vibrio coralliirubri]|uniref:hypothetical protein n=1 Tax=Vibrio coralliirubri TaxID=1516159 RepID=UPI00228370AC|nr:hypothetical protein [Vibrio coralliirubri]MCY9861025.1 hypothetical protein [Vibrio coralliirubri]